MDSFGQFLVIRTFHLTLENVNLQQFGASSYHSGIDIPASNGTNVYAVESGIITFSSWGAGGGYTIVLEIDKNPNISVSYCHLSPNYIVKRNDYVEKGELIAYVGPKNVYGINNNPYKDSNGNPTNRCNYWFSFAFNNKSRWHRS